MDIVGSFNGSDVVVNGENVGKVPAFEYLVSLIDNNSAPSVPPFVVSEAEVRRILQRLDMRKAAGPDRSTPPPDFRPSASWGFYGHF